MNEVELSSENVEPPDWMPDLSSVAREVYGHTGHTEWEIGVLLCDEARIAELNETYRHVSGLTDVLTFTNDEAGIGSAVEPITGDIAISVPVVVHNSRDYGVAPPEEFLRVYVHALLHLAGYTHDGVDLSSPHAAEHPMLGLQEALVTRLYKELDS